nr:alpha/beta hydrolase [Streptomyces sp. DSM 41633]
MAGPPPGSASWRADPVLGEELPDPARSTPAEVALFFSGLSAAERQLLLLRHPSVVGNLDGAPVELRYRANALALAAEDDPRYHSLAAPGRQILAFDPRGRGQVAEVFGDLRSARRDSVVVPGSDTDAGTFDREGDVYGTPAGMARSLHAEAGPGTAVIAWADYTAPAGLGMDAALGVLAAQGAVRLNALVGALPGASDVSLVCHSYGSVVCGVAADDAPARVTDIAVAGSPGMRAENAARLRTDARIWAMRDEDDWIGDVPHMEFGGIGHGADPVDPAFGARLVSAAGAAGHSGY